MTTKTCREQVVECLATTLGWSLEEASNVTGDTTEYEDDGLSVTEAADTIIDAMRASA